MGYRSKLICGVQNKHKEDFTKILLDNEWIVDLDDNQLVEIDDFIVFRSFGCDYKLYPNYEDVGRLYNYLNELWSDDDTEEEVFSVAMGEDGHMDDDWNFGDWWEFCYTINDVNLNGE